MRKAEQKRIGFYITLNSGREVSIESISISRTYGGVLTASRDGANGYSWLNKKILEDLKCPKDWGKIKTHIIKPDEMDLIEPMPFNIYSVSLSSNPIEKNNDKSELVLIWLGDLDIDKSIKDNVEDVIKKVEWEKYAEDFSY